MQEEMYTDRFFWLKKPVISEMRAILEWAHKCALREVIRCEEIGEVERYLSDRDFSDIVAHIGREDKNFFRIILRRGMNRFMALDNKKESDILDIGIHCVKIGTEYYYINLYLSGTLLGKLKRKFSLTEQI